MAQGLGRVVRSEQAMQELLGGACLLAIDAGSRGGVPDHWRPFLGPVEVHGFEPDAEACRIAQQRDPPPVHHHPTALGRRDGEERLYVTRAPSSSSFYPPNLPFFTDHHGTERIEVVETVQVKTRSLASFAKEEGISEVHAMKLDIQGAELDVFQGAGALLDTTLCIETEVEFAELYLGQPLFCDVNRFLVDHGFELWDLRTHRVYRAKAGRHAAYLRDRFGATERAQAMSARLVAGDALYIRTPASLPDPHTDLITHRRWIALACIYGYYDAAVAHVEWLEVQEALTAEDASAAISAIKRLYPGTRLVERNHLLGRALRALRGRLGLETEKVFWVRRRFPDQ